jgi:hypothetical protein
LRRPPRPRAGRPLRPPYRPPLPRSLASSPECSAHLAQAGPQRRRQHRLPRLLLPAQRFRPPPLPTPHHRSRRRGRAVTVRQRRFCPRCRRSGAPRLFRLRHRPSEAPRRFRPRHPIGGTEPVPPRHRPSEALHRFRPRHRPSEAPRRFRPRLRRSAVPRPSLPPPLHSEDQRARAGRHPSRRAPARRPLAARPPSVHRPPARAGSLRPPFGKTSPASGRRLSRRLSRRSTRAAPRVAPAGDTAARGRRVHAHVSGGRFAFCSRSAPADIPASLSAPDHRRLRPLPEACPPRSPRSGVRRTVVLVVPHRRSVLSAVIAPWSASPRGGAAQASGSPPLWRRSQSSRRVTHRRITHRFIVTRRSVARRRTDRRLAIRRPQPTSTPQPAAHHRLRPAPLLTTAGCGPTLAARLARNGRSSFGVPSAPPLRSSRRRSSLPACPEARSRPSAGSRHQARRPPGCTPK